MKNIDWKDLFVRAIKTFAEAAINDDYLEEIRKGDQFTVKGAEK